MNAKTVTTMKIGELARRAGVSVRTLHHYDEIGLVRPARTTPTGHRLYDRAALARLGHVRSLCRLGFSLAEVNTVLSPRSRVVRDRVERRIREVRVEMDRVRTQLGRLKSLHERLANDAEAHELADLLERERLFEHYFTPSQRRQIEQHAKAMGVEALRAWKQRSADLIDAVRREWERGAEASSPTVQALGRAQRDHLRMITHGDQELGECFARLYHAEPECRRSRGIPDALYEFLESSSIL